MRRRCHADTGEIPAGYVRPKFLVNVSHSMTGRHVSAYPGAARRRRQGPKPRTPHARAARSAADLTLAEHSSTLNDVMAGRASTADPDVERQGDRRQTRDKMFGSIACK